MYIEEQYANDTEENTIIDTVLYACEEYNVDPEMVEPLINRSVKEKMRVEYVKLNYLKDDTACIA